MHRVCLAVFLILASLSSAITVRTLDEQFSQSNQTVLRFRIENTSNHVEYVFNSNSELSFNSTGHRLAGSLVFQRNAKLNAPTNGSIAFHVGNDFQWNGTIVADDMVEAARYISIFYYGTNHVFIQSNFAGTIVAPNAEVVIGQSGKRFYGAIYAKSIVVHQNTKVTWVPFVEESMGTTIVMRNTEIGKSLYVADLGKL